jgi:hypothetical protein
MKRIAVALAFGALGWAAIPGVAGSAAAAGEGARREPTIVIDDVARFYRIYDAAGGHPTADQLQHDYLDRGSEGLHHLAKVRNVTGATIAAAIAKRPDIYANARSCMAVLPKVRRRAGVVLHRLIELYPEAKVAPVTIVVGRGRPVAIGGPGGEGVQFGLEALCAVKWFNPNLEDRFVYGIAHEYVHVQQSPVVADDEHPTVLELAIVEGAAEFTAELISGAATEVTPHSVGFGPNTVSTRGRENDIETAFVADEDKTDLSQWFNNSTLEKPGDLGYWVGYRIVKSYYQHAPDKRQALREILQMADPKAFLAKSSWKPGMHLR